MSLFSHSQEDFTKDTSRVRWEPVNPPSVGMLVLFGIALAVALAAWLR